MSPFDYIKDISEGKKYILAEDDGEYIPFIINKAFSLYPDTIMLANEANQLASLDKRLQHDFLFNSIKKRKRWAKWPKKDKNEDLALIIEFYKYSIEKARSVLPLLNADQLAKIKEELTQGGVEKTWKQKM